MPFPYIFTFYSFKGGVGRSMAVMNVAYTLAGRGRHVLVVDMDLEAPGLSGFLNRSGEFAAAECTNPLDVLDLLTAAAAALRRGGDLRELGQSLPPVSNYIRPVAEEKLQSLRPKLGQLGHLDVLRTDLDRNYWPRLGEIGLPDLQHEQLMDLSEVLHHYFKAQTFPHRPLGVEPFEPPVDTHYDYVLVDSRTGSTEIGGLCIGPLADRLVVITGLNDQNVHGTLEFLKEAGIRPVPRPPDDQPWDDADPVAASGEDRRSLGPKPTIVVGSPVPAGEILYKRERQKVLQDNIGIRPLTLSYHPQMALMESVFVRDYREEYLADEYLRLASRLMEQVADDPPRLASKATEAQNKKGDLRAAIIDALRLAAHEPNLGLALLPILANAVPEPGGSSIPETRQIYALLAQSPETAPFALINWGVALFDQAKTKTGEEADRLYVEASVKYAEALRRKPDNPEALNNWGVAIAGQAKTKTGEEADRLYTEASAKYAEALRLKPHHPKALYNWGNALSKLAKTKTGEEANRLYAEASAKYAEALRLKPDNPDALNNWGVALSDQANTKTGEEADSLFAKATAKYAEALRLKPDYPEALNNWGNALYDQAKTKTGEDADQLFEVASAKSADALRLKPDFPEALNNLGNALSGRAKTKTGEEADRLYAEAIGKYAEALRLKPDNPEALNNWGVVLLSHAARKFGDVAQHLRQEAREKLLKAEDLEPGSAALNLACLEAQLGDAERSIHWLRTLAPASRPSRAKIAGETDFDPIRDHPAFQAFRESLSD